MACRYYSEADVRAAVDMPRAIEQVEAAFLNWSRSLADNQPRRRVSVPGGMLHALMAADAGRGCLAFKIYTTTAGNAPRFLVGLASAKSGEFLAMMEADWLGRLRTGAASGVATKLLANRSAKCAAFIGVGAQAETQLQAIATVRRLESIRVHSRDAARGAAFADRMSRELGVPCTWCESAERTVRDADIVTTITNSASPVLRREWLQPGCHVNLAGSNHPARREADSAVVVSADRVICDSVAACQLEAGDLKLAEGFDWSGAVELRDVVRSPELGRAAEHELTVFKSVGLAIEDLAMAAAVYEQSPNGGTPLPF